MGEKPTQRWTTARETKRAKGVVAPYKIRQSVHNELDRSDAPGISDVARRRSVTIPSFHTISERREEFTRREQPGEDAE